MKAKHHYRVFTELDFGEYSRKLEMPEISKMILIAAVYCDIKSIVQRMDYGYAYV